ncbi:MAG: hypothetical protein AAGC77_12040 [Pseudomonadota bacterium]
MNSPMPVRSQLTRFHTSRRDPETVRREGWREIQIFAVNADDPRLDDFERQFIKNLGSRLYGERLK